MEPAKIQSAILPSWMEPMLPSDGKASEDMAFDLISNANALAGQIHPIVPESVGNLVRSMNCSILQPSELLRRMEIYVEDETRAGRLPKGSFPLLREALLAGEFERGLAPSLTGYVDRL